MFLVLPTWTRRNQLAYPQSTHLHKTHVNKYKHELKRAHVYIQTHTNKKKQGQIHGNFKNILDGRTDTTKC